METYRLYRLLAGLALLLCPLLARGQSGRVAEPAACVLQWSSAQLGVREATGHNDGPEIEAWQRAVGAALRGPWCGVYQAAGQRHCGLPYPKGAAGSYNWFLPSSPRTYYIKGKQGSVERIKPGHQVGFYYPNLGRIAHVARTVAPARKRGNRGWYCNEGNTGSGGGRDGAGVHLLLRANWEFYAASNWLH